MRQHQLRDRNLKFRVLLSSHETQSTKPPPPSHSAESPASAVKVQIASSFIGINSVSRLCQGHNRRQWELSGGGGGAFVYGSLFVNVIQRLYDAKNLIC